MGNFRRPVVVGSRFFQKTFNKDNNVPGLGCKLPKAHPFGGSPPPASKAALPCPTNCCCFDFSSRTISTINLRAFVIPESSVSGKEAASRMLPLSTHFSPGRRGVSESAMQHDSERWRGSDKQGQFCEPLHAGPAQSHSRSQLCGRPGRLHYRTGRTVIISDESPGLALNVLPCVKLDHFHPRLQGK